MGVPYTFGTATTSIPLSQLDANFNTPVTLGNTTVGLGNTVTTVGNLTLTNVTITSGTINAAVVDSGYVANSVVYANSTGVLTAGSANFVFDGTNVGIGTSSPTCRLDLNRGSAGLLANFTDGVNTNFQIETASLLATIGPSAGSTGMAFKTGNTERMRITSGGDLIVGGTTVFSNARVTFNSTTAANPCLSAFKTVTGDTANPAIVVSKFDNDSTTAQVIMQFLFNNGASGLGQINGNGSGAAAFGTYSDIRLKENITNIDSQLGNICALRPVEFDYKTGGHQIGFIAQEMQEIYPDAVGTSADDMLTITGWSKTEARLVKAIQEQQALIENLTTRLNALEGN